MKETSGIINNKIVTIFHDDDRFIREVLENNEYRDVFNDLVVMDIGANIGTFSFWIYAHAKVIYAIEPSERNVECMNKTIEYNDLDRIKTYCIGISESGGDRQFYVDENPGGGNWKLDPDPVPIQSPSVAILPTKTISQFMKDENIDYVDVLKIDIEGAEESIFESQAFKSVAHRIGSVIGEYHHGLCPTELLEKCGYRVNNISNHSKFVARRR